MVLDCGPDFEFAHDAADRIAAAHPLYTPPTRLPELVKGSDPIIQHTFDTGEGVLIPAEIIHYAKEGCRSFVISSHSAACQTTS